MPKFIVAPHFRLQEWVAEEKGYFAAEGLDYDFARLLIRVPAAGISLATRSALIRRWKPDALAMSAPPATGR